MGVFTDNMQALNRGFVSERAEKKALQKKKNAYKDFLYKKFYNKFYSNQNSDPIQTFAFYQQPVVTQNIICDEKFEDLPGSVRIELYHSILTKTYKQFKNNYNLNISTEKQEKEEEKELEKVLKEYQKALKENEKAKQRYKKAKQQQRQQLLRCKKEISKGFAKIGLGLIIGGRVASKTYRKIK